MDFKFLNSFLWMAMLIITCFAVACGNEEHGQPDYEEKPLFNVAINFSTLSTREGNSLVTENIKSFRVIVTSSENGEEESDSSEESVNGETVQLNQFVTEASLASTFQYYLLWQTNKGTKNFYLFANEESVGNLSYSNGSSDETNLSELLNSFNVGDDASDLKSILTSAYFTPKYEINNSNCIYLPYTSIYEGVEVMNNNESYKMFLVPVATKFFFNFINYRPSDVYINGISLNSTNTDNYLFANVGESNLQMTLPGDSDSLFWIDWLDKVSKLSQDNCGYNQNQSFNTLYGWIWDYSIPTSEVNDPYVFVAPDTQLQIKGISYPETDEDNEDEGEEVEGIPGNYCAGPYYVPESKVNVEPPDTTKGGRQFQRYYLTIGMADSDPDNKDNPEFDMVEIDNLKALFRNTCVIINLVMRQGDVEIYAQIAPWIEQQSFGYVNEGNKPGFLNKSSGL